MHGDQYDHPWLPVALSLDARSTRRGLLVPQNSRVLLSSSQLDQPQNVDKPMFSLGMQMHIAFDYSMGYTWLGENLVDFSEQST